jgi:hypothetical protein
MRLTPHRLFLAAKTRSVRDSQNFRKGSVRDGCRVAPARKPWRSEFLNTEGSIQLGRFGWRVGTCLYLDYRQMKSSGQFHSPPSQGVHYPAVLTLGELLQIRNGQISQD